MPVGNDFKRATRVTLGSIHVTGFRVEMTIGESHHEFRFAPRRFKRIVACFDFRTDFQSSLVVRDRLALAAAAFGWRIPKNGATHPDQSWIVRRHCAGFFLRREDLLDPFFLARFILWIRKQEKSQ